ncbi:MAG: serine--tRNA ligase [Candidatus Aenigmarchaeota archaeon]|nr:serine--tRNA ligase [Candidatus Aenigmarchaeota archaeon]
MIDVNILRNNPEVVKENFKRRDKDDSLLNQFIKADRQWRESLGELNELRRKRNNLSKEVAEMKQQKKSVEKKLAEMKELPKKISEFEKKTEELKNKLDNILLLMPNILHDSVPKGKDENDNVVVRKWGKKPDIKNPKDHIDLGLALDLFDIERAAKISGSRFYFLKNEAVTLELVLAQFATDLLKKKGFTLLIPPFLITKNAMQGAGWLPVGEEDIYMIQREGLCLIGTSEQPLAGYHMNETLTKDQLPKYYCGFSPCFRTEAGSHGRDTKGIFRVHQFEKIEMFIYSSPEDSWNEHEKLIKTAEEFQQKLGMHYRVVNVCSGEMGMVAAKKYDIEAWFPGQNKYREVVSCSNCTDYQARRMNTKYAEKKGAEPKGFAHTLNSTALALGRTIVAIIENYQREDGSIEVPKALQKYTDFKEIAR